MRVIQKENSWAKWKSRLGAELALEFDGHSGEGGVESGGVRRFEGFVDKPHHNQG